jgi:hypothetical protein
VAVPLRLDDGPQLGAVEDGEEPLRVPTHGAEVDGELRPVHDDEAT